MNIIIKINKIEHNFIVDENDNIMDKLLELVEKKIKISNDFYYLRTTTENITDNCKIDLVWRNSYFLNDLKSFYVSDKEYRIPKSILLESKVVKTILSPDGVNDNIDDSDDENKLMFATDILNTESINDWINLSCEINTFLNLENKSIDDINIPKPLMNKSISYYIGEKPFNYLNNMNFKSLEKLATLTDFLDINYLLEIACAFIAEKYIKNKPVKEIKELFES